MPSSSRSDKTQGMDPLGFQGRRLGNSITAGETAEGQFPKQNLQIEFPFETPSTYPYFYFHFISNGGSPCKDLPVWEVIFFFYIALLHFFFYISDNTTPLNHCNKNHGIYLLYSQNVIL